MRFEGKIALVTGAASGIGAAVVQALATEGASVIAADINQELLQIQWGGQPRIRTAVLDVTDETQWAELFSNLEKLDILVASAGVSHASPLASMPLSDWRRVMAINLDGAFLAIRHAVGPMKANGGSIVLLGSASGIKVAPGASAYSASKAALRMLAKSAAVELKPDNIRVNTVSPAGVATPMWKTMDFFQKMVEEKGSEQAAWDALGGVDPQQPALHRMAFAEEIAKSVLFLCSGDAAGITGTDLVIDAGYTL